MENHENKLFWDSSDKEPKKFYWESPKNVKKLALRSRVKPLEANNRDDINQVRDVMQELGYYRGAPVDHYDRFMMDKPLESSIRKYQKDRNLEVDGMLNPDGETQRSINNDLEERQNKKKLVCNPATVRKTYYELRDKREELNPFKHTFLKKLDSPLTSVLPTDIQNAINIPKHIWDANAFAINVRDAIRKGCTWE